MGTCCLSYYKLVVNNGAKRLIETEKSSVFKCLAQGFPNFQIIGTLWTIYKLVSLVYPRTSANIRVTIRPAFLIANPASCFSETQRI